jgi:tripartite ATP-independent transporter DctP family solute receptor
MKIRHATIGFAAAIATTFATGTLAQEEIIFGISAATGSLQEQTASEFARRANEKLGDTAVVKVFDSSQLGKDKDMLQKIKLGTMHLTLPSSTMPEIANEYAIFDLPFLVANREHLARIDETLFTEVLVPAAEAQGYRPLAIWENGFRQITNNERPINTPADLAGLKIRTPNSSWRVAMFEAYGANPTPMGFSEVFVALQTGVIDGQENPLTNIAGGKLNEVQKYLSMSGHVYSPAYPTGSRLSRSSIRRSRRCWPRPRRRWRSGRANRARSRTERCSRSWRPAAWKSTSPTASPSSTPRRRSTRSSPPRSRTARR